ncbi:MAG: translation initiation factor IF-2 [Pseudomonadales bacterium]|nr:translation initiation factor IF-2 [Pseudomonadales bacterium]
MAEVTVKQLAGVVGVPVDKLLQQMRDAGLTHGDAEQTISDDEKQQLLSFLKEAHGETEPQAKKITLKRKSVSRLKVGGNAGKSKTVNVEIRKKRTYVKRSAVQEEEKEKQEAEENARLEAEAKIQAEESKRLEEEKEKREATTLQAEVKPKPVKAPKSSRDKILKRTSSVQKKSVAMTPEEKAAEDKRKADELARRRVEDDTRQKAEAEAAKKTQEAAKRVSEELEARGGDSKKELFTEELVIEDEIVKQAFEESLVQEQKSTKRAKRSGDRKRLQVKARRKLKGSGEHGFQSPTGPIIREVEIGEVISVSDLANQMSVKGMEVVKALMKMGVMASINQTIDQETAILVTEELGHTVATIKENQVESDLVDSLIHDDQDVNSRAPVVTIMGHVDHGKTSLLDYIRRAKVNVTDGEAGGITQHIGAYHVDTDHGSITFLDTPGHAAFSAMRARGANCTDIVIIVVAADDGVMPQTEEAINHAKAANAPIIIAVNKIDKEQADPDRVKNELAARDVIPEDWGGDIQFINVSAITGEGVEALLEAVLLQTELMELTAVNSGPAKGIVIESRLDKGRGAVASLLVQSGELQHGDLVLAGPHYGRVKAMFDENGLAKKEIGPSMPVEVLGLPGTPEAGDEFLVVSDERSAREVAEYRRVKEREMRFARQQGAKLENIFDNLKKDEIASVNIVLKTDVRGSLEALIGALDDLSTDEVKVSFVVKGVGGINESDAGLALASNGIVIGFNVRADAAAKKICQEEGVDIRYYSVIYDIINDVKAAMSGLLSPERREEILGVADVREVFRSSKFGAAAGCMVVEGTLYRNKPIRVLRDDIVIYEGELESLRRFKDDMQEVRNGMECGVAVKNYNDVKVGDKIEVFDVKEIARIIE